MTFPLWVSLTAVFFLGSSLALFVLLVGKSIGASKPRGERAWEDAEQQAWIEEQS